VLFTNVFSGRAVADFGEASFFLLSQELAEDGGLDPRSFCARKTAMPDDDVPGTDNTDSRGPFRL